MRRVLVNLDSVALNRSSRASDHGAYPYLPHDWRGLELTGPGQTRSWRQRPCHALPRAGEGG